VDSGFDYEEFQKNLSYIMRMRTKEIFKVKEQMGMLAKLILILLALVSLCLCYIVYNSHDYLEIIESNAALNSFGMYILYILFISIALAYYLCGRLSRLKSKFEDIRKCIMKLADGELCTCGRKCTCRDEYIEYMHNHKIKLLY
jgi:hypothetical protein